MTTHTRSIVPVLVAALAVLLAQPAAAGRLGYPQGDLPQNPSLKLRTGGDGPQSLPGLGLPELLEQYLEALPGNVLERLVLKRGGRLERLGIDPGLLDQVSTAGASGPVSVKVRVPVPEPTSGALLGLGLALLAGALRRRS